MRWLMRFIMAAKPRKQAMSMFTLPCLAVLAVHPFYSPVLTEPILTCYCSFLVTKTEHFTYCTSTEQPHFHSIQL